MGFFFFEHFCLEIVKFYKFFMVVLLPIHFGSGADRIWILLKVSDSTGSRSITLFNRPQYYSLFSFQKAKVQGAETKIKTKKCTVVALLNIYNQGAGRKQIPSQCFKFFKVNVSAKTAFFQKILYVYFRNYWVSDPESAHIWSFLRNHVVDNFLLTFFCLGYIFRPAVHIIQCIGPEPVLGHNDRQIFISLRPPPFQLNSIHNPSNLYIF